MSTIQEISAAIEQLHAPDQVAQAPSPFTDLIVSRPRSVLIILALLAVSTLGIAEGRASAAKGFAIYVSNERSGEVSVIDGATNAVVATIPAGKRPRGIQCAPGGNFVYLVLSGSPRMAPGVETERAPADKSADALIKIDAVTRKVVERWHVGSDPEQFALSKDGKFAFIANEDDASASMIDLSSGQARGKIKVSEEPEGVGVNPGNGDVYVTCEEKGEVFVFSPNEQKVKAQIEVGARPRSVAFSPDGARAYVACENAGSVAVLETSAAKVIAKIQLPEGSLPMGTVVSPNGRELYVATGRGNHVAVIKTETNEVVAMIPVGQRAWGIALSPDGSRLYTANGGSNDISVIDVAERKEITRIKVGDGPWGMAIVPRP